MHIQSVCTVIFDTLYRRSGGIHIEGEVYLLKKMYLRFTYLPCLQCALNFYHYAYRLSYVHFMNWWFWQNFAYTVILSVHSLFFLYALYINWWLDVEATIHSHQFKLIIISKISSGGRLYFDWQYYSLNSPKKIIFENSFSERRESTREWNSY